MFIFHWNGVHIDVHVLRSVFDPKVLTEVKIFFIHPYNNGFNVFGWLGYCLMYDPAPREQSTSSVRRSVTDMGANASSEFSIKGIDGLDATLYATRPRSGHL